MPNKPHSAFPADFDDGVSEGHGCCLRSRSGTGSPELSRATTPSSQLPNKALQLTSFVGRPSASLWHSQLNAGTLGRRSVVPCWMFLRIVNLPLGMCGHCDRRLDAA